MKRCFADTYYFLAMLNSKDSAHEAVTNFTGAFDGWLITSDWVLVEVGEAMSDPGNRERFMEFVDFLRRQSRVRIIRASKTWFDRGLALFAERRDKEWSLTDCISFAIMHQNRLKDALTGDHHFRQAGFHVLFD